MQPEAAKSLSPPLVSGYLVTAYGPTVDDRAVHGPFRSWQYARAFADGLEASGSWKNAWIGHTRDNFAVVRS